MKYDNFFGIIAEEIGWVPAPSYLMRRNKVLNTIRNIKPGTVLEIGCGAGALLNDIQKLGFQAEAVEFSPKAVEIAKYINSDISHSIFNSFDQIEKNNSKFDYIMAFEVLEHIEDDFDALSSWVNYLKPGGKAILSVPAHPKKWNASDNWAGHFRRYTKGTFEELVTKCGLKIELITSYGFPLQNMIRPVRAHFHKKSINKNSKIKNIENSKRSGVERTMEMKLFKYQNTLLGKTILKSSFKIQNTFSKTFLGNGLLCIAVKQ